MGIDCEKALSGAEGFRVNNSPKRKFRLQNRPDSE